MSLAMTIAWLASVAPGAGAGQEAPVNALIYPVGIVAGLALGVPQWRHLNVLTINSLCDPGDPVRVCPASPGSCRLHDKAVYREPRHVSGPYGVAGIACRCT